MPSASTPDSSAHLTLRSRAPYNLLPGAMAVPTFDSIHAVRFDLPHGAVHAKGDPERCVVVPSAALDSLIRDSSPEAAELFGRAWGSAIGKRLASRLEDAESATLDDFVTQFAGEAAISGIGTVALERWGRALVVVIGGSPLSDSTMESLVAAAVEAACGLRPVCAAVSRDGETSRIFAGTQVSVDRLRAYLGSGLSWADAIARLH